MRRRRRIKTDWVIAHWDEAEATIAGGAFHVVDLITHGDLETKQDRLTVLRVVGNFDCRTVSTTPASELPFSRVWLRIQKGDDRHLAPGSYSQAAFPEYSPNLVGNADEGFSWQRMIPMSPGDGDNYRFDVFYQSPWWGIIDTKVKRALRNDERLTMFIHPIIRDTAGTPLALGYMMNLRALVRTF